MPKKPLEINDRTLNWPLPKSPRWTCSNSECTWSAPPEQEIIGGQKVDKVYRGFPLLPTQETHSSFDRHKCEHYPKRK
jgi:hypothetical protein